MQSLNRDKVRISDQQLLSSASTHENIQKMNLKRYEKLYTDYENHLREDLERERAELQNSEVVETLLRKIKKQIFDQLKQIQSLEDRERNEGNSREQVEEQRGHQQLSMEGRENAFLQTIMEQSNNMQIDWKNYRKEERERVNVEEYSNLRSQVQKYKQLYFSIDQRLNQEMIDYHQYQQKDTYQITEVKPHLLKRKLEIVLNLKSKQMQSTQVQPYPNLAYFQKKQLQLKMLIKGKQIEEYRYQIEQTHKKLRNLQSEIAKLEIQSRQVKQLRNQNSILKMKIFGMQNVQNVHNEVPQISQNLPELVRSQIFNLKDKTLQKQNQNKQRPLINNPYLFLEQNEQHKLKQGMIRQNLEGSLKHYKKKYSQLQKRYNEHQNQFKTFIEKTKLKINDYNTLIQKLHFQLEKSYLQISEKSAKSHMAEAYRNWQQKIEAVSSKNTMLNKQMAEKHQIFNRERLKFQTQSKAMKKQTQRLSKENNDLKMSVRQFKNQMLQQQLNLDMWKSQNQSTANAQKAKTIQSLNQQITLLRSQFEEKSDLLLKEISKNERLKQVNQNLSRELQQNKNQTLRLRQKNQQIHSKLTQSNKFSEQLENTKQKLELEELQTQNLQKKLAHYINETKEYQNRVRELEETLTELAHQSQEKSMYIMKINHQNQQLAHRIQKLEEQFDIFEQKGSSLKKIQYINRSSELQSEVQTLKRNYSQVLKTLNLKQHQIEYLKSQCDRFIEQNLRYLKVIRQKGLEIDVSFLNDEKQYEYQRSNRIKQLEQKISHLIQDNELLKNLVEEMRSKLTEKNIPSSAVLASKHQDQIYELRNALLNAERTIENYTRQVQELQERCNTEKSVFKEQWNKLIAQYTDRSKPQKNSLQNQNDYAKIQDKHRIELTQSNRFLKRDLQRKQQELKMLKITLEKQQKKKSQKTVEVFDQEKVPEYFRQLVSLREEVQKLKQQRFYIQVKLRQLEQENSSLKIKLISSDKYQSPSLLYPPNMGKTQIGNLGQQSSFKSGQMDQEVVSSLKTSERESQTKKRPEIDNFRNLVSLAPLVQSVRGEESFTRLSSESK